MANYGVRSRDGDSGRDWGRGRGGGRGGVIGWGRGRGVEVFNFNIFIINLVKTFNIYYRIALTVKQCKLQFRIMRWPSSRRSEVQISVRIKNYFKNNI